MEEQNDLYDEFENIDWSILDAFPNEIDPLLLTEHEQLPPYNVDASTATPRPSIEQHEPITSSSAPTVVDPHLVPYRCRQPQHDQAYGGGAESTLFSDTIPSGYRQHTPNRAHQHPVSQPEHGPYFQHQSTSDSGTRSQYDSPDLDSTHSRFYSSHAQPQDPTESRGMGMLNSPASIFGAQNTVPAQKYHVPVNMNFHSHTPTQLPERNLYQAYQTQYQSTPQPFSQLEISPSPNFTSDQLSRPAFSPESTHTPDPELDEDNHNELGPLVPPLVTHKQSVKCVEPACKNFFKKSVLPDRCKRCALKHIRHNASPVLFAIHPAVPDFEAATQLIQPPIIGKGPALAPHELRKIMASENEYIQRFLDAVNEVVVGGEHGDVKDKSLDFYQRQQILFNQDATLDPAYSPERVTARFRYLFAHTVAFYAGSPKRPYPISGDSLGYPENTKLSFDERIDKICEFLRVNKRIVKDVVEGRGVQGFVGNPVLYNKRKTSNNECNVQKAGLIDKGKEKANEDGETPPRKRVARGRKRQRTLLPVDEEAGLDLTQAGSSYARAMATDVDGTDDSDRDYEPAMSNDITYGPGRPMTARLTRGRRH